MSAHGGLFKAAINLTQDAFRRIDVQPCGWTELDRDPLFVHASALRTLIEQREPAPPCPGKEPPRRPTLRPLGSPRGSPRRRRKDGSHRLLQPTYDTSTRTIARLPSPQLAPRRPPPRCARSVSPDAIRRAASDHLAAIRPQVEQRLTARLQLRTSRPRPSLFFEEETSPARWRSFLCAAFSAARKAGDPASDAPCRAPRPPVFRRLRSARTASTACASTHAAFPIRSAFHRRVRSSCFRGGAPATVPAALPPRSGFRRSFALPMLSHGGARP